ncbi:hypothetical protein ACH5BF_00450 [Arcobacter sp. YIC-464]|uniref:hypothetical protein n=1 Tax=Arcobacter sp. YIC-464 TaxID=3376631 RepID=UPI003C279E4D
MRFIYIKNYLKIPRESKLLFFKFVSSLKKCRLENQKVVLSDNSLILEFCDDSNIDMALNQIKEYFKKETQIDVKKLQSLLLDSEVLTLVFDENNKKRIYL